MQDDPVCASQTNFALRCLGVSNPNPPDLTCHGGMRAWPFGGNPKLQGWCGRVGNSTGGRSQKHSKKTLAFSVVSSKFGSMILKMRKQLGKHVGKLFAALAKSRLLHGFKLGKAKKPERTRLSRVHEKNVSTHFKYKSISANLCDKLSVWHVTKQLQYFLKCVIATLTSLACACDWACVFE